jgi:membrane protein required for colicin V production
MNYVDIALLAFVAVGATMGLLRGFVREIISTIGLLLAAVIANFVSPVANPYLSRWGNESSTAAAIIWVVIFLVVLFVLRKLTFIITRMLKTVMLGGVNKLLGAVFGALKFLLIACLVVTLLEFVCSKFPDTQMASQLHASRIVPYIHDVVGFLSPYIDKYIVTPTRNLL